MPIIKNGTPIYNDGRFYVCIHRVRGRSRRGGHDLLILRRVRLGGAAPGGLILLTTAQMKSRMGRGEAAVVNTDPSPARRARRGGRVRHAHPELGLHAA